jgi:HSP20 family protein
MVEDSKDSDKGKKEQDKERIERLEKRIAELEKASRKEEKEIRMEGLVENVVGQFIPGLGGIIKALEDSSPEFRQKIADTDAEIKHRIDVGWSSKPVVDYHVSTRPLRRGPGKTAPRTESVRMPASGPDRAPIVDVLEGKDGITVIAELPGISEEELKIDLQGDNLEIQAGRFSKKIALPCKAHGIQEKSYKNGILQLKLN